MNKPNKRRYFLSAVVRQLTDTYSIFWRVYESIAALIGWIFLFSLTLSVWNIFAPKFNLAQFYEGDSDWIVRTFWGALLWIIFADVIKYAITRSHRDSPFRKWFSFKWGQRFKPDEVVIFPTGYDGPRESLKLTKCGNCGVRHAFAPEEIENRICALNRCGGIVEAPVLDVQTPTPQGPVEDERNAQTGDNQQDIIDEIGWAPLRFLFRHAWTIAEHAFKLTAWMVGASAVAAFGQKSESGTIMGLGLFLAAIWVTVLAATLFRVTGYLHDMALDQWILKKNRHPIVSIVLGAIIAAAVVLPAIQVFFALISVFLEFLRRGGLS